MKRFLPPFIIVVALAFVGSACSSSLVETGPGTTSPSTSGTVPDSSDSSDETSGDRGSSGVTMEGLTADDVVFAVSVGGGFVPIEFALREYPQLVVFADGRMVLPGVQPAIFPGPALPSMEVIQRDIADIEQLLTEAAGSGLFDGQTDFGFPPVADAPSTTVTAWVDGELREVRAEALGIDDGQMKPAFRDARDALSGLLDLAYGDWPGGGGDGEAYVPDRWIVQSTEFFENAEFPVGDPIVWPLGAAIFGFDQLAPDDGRPWCAVLSGELANAAVEAAAGATELSEWDVDGQRRTMLFAPRFAHQPGCAA